MGLGHKVAGHRSLRADDVPEKLLAEARTRSGRFDVTRERTRQIEAKALRKLKHPSRSDKLRSFIDTL